jgi:putative spermidine/putrescine transport system permease protein
MKKSPLFSLVLPGAMMLAVLYGAPMIWLLVRTLAKDGFTNFAKFLGDDFYRGILWNTLWVSLRVTVICLLLGYPAAFFLARTKSGIKNILMIVIIFPFLVSAVVRSYGWMVILGTRGLLNQALLGLHLIGTPLKLLNTSTAVIIGLVHLLLPYMVLAIAGVIQSINKNIEYAAYSLGAPPLVTFLQVLLPLSSPGVVSGSILVFTLSMTSYVTPKLLGGARFRMMSTMIFQEINVNFNWGFASAISYKLLAAILLLLVASNYATAGIEKRAGSAHHG